MKADLLVLAVATTLAATACEKNKNTEQVGGQTPEEQVTQEPLVGEREPEMEPTAAREAPTEAKEEMPTEAKEAAEEGREATELVNSAAQTLREMKSDARLTRLIGKARAVFIVPNYGRAALGVGGSGGEGVLIGHQKGKWSGPAFYDIGGISVGAQIGGEGGQIAMLLMNDKALKSFTGDDSFSLNADAKITLADYSKLKEKPLGKAGDVVFWSSTEGAFAGVALSATDIAFDEEENAAYYGKKVTAEEVLRGKVEAPETSALQEALSGA